MDQIKEILQSFFYELARDHLPVGKLNNVLMQTIPHREVEFTDKKLAEWAEYFAEQLVGNKLFLEMPNIRDKVRLCGGCNNDFYNSKNDLGIKRCWSLEKAKIVQRKEVGINDIPPWDHQPVRTSLSCYHRKGYVYVKPDQTC